MQFTGIASLLDASGQPVGSVEPGTEHLCLSVLCKFIDTSVQE